MRKEEEIRNQIEWLNQISGEALNVLSDPNHSKFMDFVDLDGFRRTRQRTLAAAAILDWVLEAPGVEPPSAG